MRPDRAGHARAGHARAGHGRADRVRLRGAIAATLAGFALLGLTACSSGPGSVTVQGKLIDIVGNPVANVDVLVGGTLTTTAADGSFTVSAVSTPYDVAIDLEPSNSGASRPTALVYRGLTLARPTLPIIGAVGPPPYGDNVSGTVGSTLTTELGVLLAGGAGYFGGFLKLDSTDTPNFGPMQVGWGGSSSRPTTLFALTTTLDSNSLPLSYTGYADTSLTLTDGVDRTGVNDTLSGTGLSTLQESGNVTAPSGYTLVNSSSCVVNGTPPCLAVSSLLLLRFTKGATGAAFGLRPGVTTAQVPRDSAGTIGYALMARAEPAGAQSDDTYTAAVAAAPNAGPGTSNSLTLRDPPNPLTPTDGATGVTSGTSFSWQSLANSIYAVHLSPSNGSTTDPEVFLLTAGTHATVPDLSKLGIQLPATTQYDYTVTAVGPFSTVDAAANRPLLFLEAQMVMNQLFDSIRTGSNGPFAIPFPVRDLRIAQAAHFTFTTQ